MANCEYCNTRIKITRDKLTPMWNVVCQCTVTQHAHLEYALSRHKWKAGMGEVGTKPENVTKAKHFALKTDETIKYDALF